MPITSLTSYFNTSAFGDRNTYTQNQTELALTLDSAAHELSNWKSLLAMSSGGAGFELGNLAARTLLSATPALCAVPLLTNAFAFGMGAISDTGLTHFVNRVLGNAEGEESFLDQMTSQGSVRLMGLVGIGQCFAVVQVLQGMASVGRGMLCEANSKNKNSGFLHHLILGLQCHFGSGMFTCLTGGMVNAVEARISLRTKNIYVGTPSAGSLPENLRKTISDGLAILSDQGNPHPSAAGSYENIKIDPHEKISEPCHTEAVRPFPRDVRSLRDEDIDHIIGYVKTLAPFSVSNRSLSRHSDYRGKNVVDLEKLVPGLRNEPSRPVFDLSFNAPASFFRALYPILSREGTLRANVIVTDGNVPLGWRSFVLRKIEKVYHLEFTYVHVDPRCRGNGYRDLMDSYLIGAILFAAVCDSSQVEITYHQVQNPHNPARYIAAGLCEIPTTHSHQYDHEEEKSPFSSYNPVTPRALLEQTLPSSFRIVYQSKGLATYLWG